MRFGRGLVQVYTGSGKGKTTAALGQALRAIGWGWRVRIFQFLKPPDSSGEHFAAPLLGDKLMLIPVGRRRWIRREGAEPEDIRLAKEGLAQAKGAMRTGQVDLLVLDEIDLAIQFQLISVGEVIECIDRRPSHVELILTGRNAAQEILERADLISEMASVKHPYKQGVRARLGIEF